MFLPIIQWLHTVAAHSCITTCGMHEGLNESSPDCKVESSRTYLTLSGRNNPQAATMDSSNLNTTIRI